MGWGRGEWGAAYRNALGSHHYGPPIQAANTYTANHPANTEADRKYGTGSIGRKYRKRAAGKN